MISQARHTELVSASIRQTPPPRVERWDSPDLNLSPEREGRSAVEAQKLLGISLDGSMG